MARRITSYCIFFFLLQALLFSEGCTGVKDLSSYNQSEIYSSTYFFHPVFALVHRNDSVSELFVKLDSKELLFSRKGEEGFRANLKIRYRLVESYEYTGIVLDSGSASFELDESARSGYRVYSVPFRDSIEGEFLLEVSILDEQKKYDELFFVNVDHTSRNSRPHFRVNLKNDTLPFFSTYLEETDTVRIRYRDNNVSRLSVKCYFRKFALAPPPFSFNVRDDFDYRPDSTFYYETGDTSYLVLNREGFYHFQADTSDKAGLTLFRFSNSFPSITSPDLMVEAVRYLTTKREYEEMKASQNKKASMDKFWMELGGGTERSKMLIKKYYTRVREANRFFTSYTDGWRTDRGMIYIVFGRPNNVYKSSTSETWIYGTPNNPLSLNFFFIKVINPFTDNDFGLRREPLFEGSWMRAVDVWRQGRRTMISSSRQYQQAVAVSSNSQ